MKSVVTVSRKWHSPTIQTTVSSEEISLSCDLVDFCEAVVQELGSVAWVFTDRTFRLKFDAAVARVLQGIKDESAKVV